MCVFEEGGEGGCPRGMQDWHARLWILVGEPGDAEREAHSLKDREVLLLHRHQLCLRHQLRLRRHQPAPTAAPLPLIHTQAGASADLELQGNTATHAAAADGFLEGVRIGGRGAGGCRW